MFVDCLVSKDTSSSNHSSGDMFGEWTTQVSKLLTDNSHRCMLNQALCSSHSKDDPQATAHSTTLLEDYHSMLILLERSVWIVESLERTNEAVRNVA